LGTSLGIVGSTGSGKTTLVDIILGLLNPSSGSIKVDDITIDKSNLRSWQNLFGYVPQEIFLTDSNITENVAFGIPKDSIDQQQVENCAQMAQIHDFINELPEGYETVVGERGVRLSGGQRQRVGIARALYRKPKVLVFDEATSALDSITEKEVVRAISNLTKELTTIIVAHRLSTVQNCDQIILLDCGKVKTFGSYEDLLEESELFRNMALV
jgi:ABC-type multidrug transport system fused ATPase/permease subunit